MAVAHFTNELRNGFLTLVRDKLNGGGIEVYAGELPLSADTALFGQLFRARLELPDPCAADPLDGALTLTVEPAAGTVEPGEPPTFARLFDADGAAVCDLDVGLLASSASLRFDTLNFIQGGTVRVSSAVFRA